MATGNVAVGSTANIAYTYDVATGNQNGRSLQKLSTNANTMMRANGNVNNAFYPDFQKVRFATVHEYPFFFEMSDAID